ncbi:MAG: EpsG family protein [Oscillospiraceae bacterium]|nr:EpsG family protein [Oscillospiraceae bacterium]
MNKLWILLAVSLAMAWIIEERDRELRYRGSQKRERLMTWILTIILIFFCGLRTWGNDTVTYMQMYDQMPVWNRYISGEMFDLATGMGFGALTSIMKTIGFSKQDYLMFFAILTVIPYVWFVRKHSVSFTFGVFLMFATGFYTFSMAAIKQTMATGLCLLAVDAALDRKWTRYGLWLVAAVLFHPYAIIYGLIPLLMFKPLTKQTWLYMVAFMAAGFFLESLLGTVLDITDMMGANYDETSFTGEGVNLFRVAVSFVPVILAMLYGKPLFRGSSREVNLMFNMAMVNALIMFVGIFGTANYFARLANYFLPAQVIILPWLLKKAHPRDRSWLMPACIVGYLGYFIYENAIIRPFDTGYSHMSFWDYIARFF